MTLRIIDILILSSVVIAAVLIVLFVWGVRRSTHEYTVALAAKSYLRHLLTWGGIGLALLTVWVIAGTVYYDSPQGPLGLVLLGPPVLGLGAVVGAFRWLANLWAT